MLRDQCIQRKGSDLPRQWTSDDYFDLILWYEEDGSIHGFQLCYDKFDNERALTWTKTKGFLHTIIDGGEDDITLKKTPILGRHAPFHAAPVIEEFKSRSPELNEKVRELVLNKLLEYSGREII